MGNQLKITQDTLPDLICPTCDGVGQHCHYCLGSSRGWLIGGYFVIWAHELDLKSVAARRTRQYYRIAVRSIFFCLGVAGLVVAALRLGSDIAAGQGIGEFFIASDAWANFFWWTLLADLYVFLSLERDLDQVVRIPRRIYETTTRYVSPVNRPSSDIPVINVWDTLTDGAQQIILLAYGKYWEQNKQLSSAGLFLTTLADPSCRYMLARLGVNIKSLEAMLGRFEASGKMTSSSDIGSVVIEAYTRAYDQRRLFLDTPYLMLATTTDPVVSEILYELNITPQKVTNVLQWQQNDEAGANYWHKFVGRARLRPRNRLDRAMTAIATPTLDFFSTDYTDLAQWGHFLPAVSRPEITEQLLRIMDGGQNVLLVGEPGVGKTGLLEDLAQHLVANDVPAELKDKRLVNLSVAKLVSGATPAEAEGRLMDLLYEAKKSGNIILAVEEIQGLTGITSGGQGSVDLANVLANFIKRLDLIMVATTTPAAYRQYIEPASLGGIFARLDLPEPTKDQTIQIVESRLGALESRYGVYFSYDAVEELVSLTDQYIHDRRLPKKALDLLDELCLFMQSVKARQRLIKGDHVKEFLAAKLRLPLATVSGAESKLLLDLEVHLHARIIAQEEAVAAVANALRRARAAMRDQRRPIANFLFLGPTGVGKTELAKAIAAIYFGDEKNMVRLDMAEYRDADGLAKLIGTAGQKGLLTEAVRRSPYALLLLDEIEKAHRDVINVFLQVMDDARLTDGTGETVDFRNVIIIATSNAGSSYIQNSITANLPMAEIQKKLLATELSGFFPPELLNRFDSVVVFKPLGLTEVEAITELMLKQLARRLDKEQGIILETTAEAVRDIAAAGFDPAFGARPLRRVIQDRIDGQLARLILEKKLSRRDIVRLRSNFEFEIIPAVKL